MHHRIFTIWMIHREGRGEGRDDHPPLGLGDGLGDAGADAGFRARRLGIEGIGRIAHQNVDALVADRRQFSL